MQAKQITVFYIFYSKRTIIAHLFVGLPKADDFAMGFLSENSPEGFPFIEDIIEHLEKLATSSIPTVLFKVSYSKQNTFYPKNY